jgi:hypothetical protein
MPESDGSANAQLPESPALEPVADTNATSDVFVSYASQDAPTANAVVAALEHRGLKCWIAPRDVRRSGMARGAGTRSSSSSRDPQKIRLRRFERDLSV